MKVNAVYFRNKSSLNLNKEIIITVSLVIIAIITGTVVSYLSDTGDEINKLLLTHISACKNSSLIKIFSAIAAENIMFLVVCFVSGSSFYGKMPIYILCFFKVTGISAVSGTLIKAYLLKGLEYCLLIFMPGKILLIFAIVYTSVNCLKSSDWINKTRLNTVSEEFSSQTYIKQILFSGTFLITSAFLDSFMLKMFLPLFDFT